MTFTGSRTGLDQYRYAVRVVDSFRKSLPEVQNDLTDAYKEIDFDDVEGSARKMFKMDYEDTVSSMSEKELRFSKALMAAPFSLSGTAFDADHNYNESQKRDMEIEYGIMQEVLGIK